SLSSSRPAHRRRRTAPLWPVAGKQGDVYLRSVRVGKGIQNPEFRIQNEREAEILDSFKSLLVNWHGGQGPDLARRGSVMGRGDAAPESSGPPARNIQIRERAGFDTNVAPLDRSNDAENIGLCVNQTICAA